MQVPRLKKWSDARPYLDRLAQTVRNDVAPLLNAPGGAPHAIAREVFCYVDHLGFLYTACHKVTERFPCYMREVMSLADAGYDAYAEIIYNMYRNGPVHEFDPKVLKNSRRERLGWCEYRGRREHEIEIEGDKTRVRHLQPFPSVRERNSFFLLVSTVCLVDDLLFSISRFADGVGSKSERRRNWNAAARELRRPFPFEFVLPSSPQGRAGRAPLHEEGSRRGGRGG